MKLRQRCLFGDHESASDRRRHAAGRLVAPRRLCPPRPSPDSNINAARALIATQHPDWTTLHSIPNYADGAICSTDGA
jgi:hypothetical protein